MSRVPKKARNADPNCEKVYAFEDSWPGWESNTAGLGECRRLIRAACDHFAVEAPVVVKHDKGFSWSIPKLSRISMLGGERLGPGHLNAAVALHEAAHHIVYKLHGNRPQDHGPIFCGVYLDLLVRGKIAPRVALEASMRSFGIKWMNP